MLDELETLALSELQTSASKTNELDADEIEIIKEELYRTLAKVNRQCNVLLNHPKGLPPFTTSVLSSIKCDLSTLRWLLDQPGAPK